MAEFQKVSKKDAGYGPGMGERRCEHCMFFDAGSCYLVGGQIDPDMWCKYFGRGSPIGKDQGASVSASSVHVPANLGIKRRKIKPLFKGIRGRPSLVRMPGPTAGFELGTSVKKPGKKLGRAALYAGNRTLRKQRMLRKLELADKNHYKVPFEYDADALKMIGDEHPSPDFLHALINEFKEDDKQKVRLDSLIATHPTVEKQKLDELDKDDKGDPVVLRWKGKNYIIDGTHHLTAAWARGKNKYKVHYVDLGSNISLATGEPVGVGVLKRNKLNRKQQSKVARTMHEWGQGELRSGSKTGPKVTDQDQAVAIALSQAKELNKVLSPILFGKADPYHDEQGRFTSAGGASSGGGGKKAGAGYEVGRATGEAAGSLAGTVAGRVAGGAIGSAIAPGVGTAAGAFIGGLAGGGAGAYLDRRIWNAVYQHFNPGVQEPRHRLGGELAGAAASSAGYIAGGMIPGVGGAAAEGAGLLAREMPTAGEATARILGTAAGDVLGTRFGDYISSRIGGVLASVKGGQIGRSGGEATGDIAADTGYALQHGLGKSLRKQAKIGNDDLPVRSDQFPPRKLRNDMNDEKYLSEQPAATNFRTLLNEQESKQRAKAGRLAQYGARIDAFQPRIGESWQQYHQRLLMAVSEQQAQAFPWSLERSK